MRTLIEGGQLITLNTDDEIITGDLLVEDDRIAAMGRFECNNIDHIIDATGKTIIPGLIQTHVHLCQTLFRGQADDMALLDWLKRRIWPLEAAHDEESITYSALLGLGELIRAGTTTVVDMGTVHHEEQICQAVAASGIRAVVGKAMMDAGDDVPPGLIETTEDSIRSSLDLISRWHNYDQGRIQYAFAPRFVLSCSEELLCQVRDLAERYQLRIHTHASENRDEVALIRSIKGLGNVAYFDRIGLTGPHLILAHCIWLDDDEKRMIRDRGVKISHCPSSNLKLSSGFAPIPEYMAMGCHVSLGADGAPCNNNLDPFTEMRLAALIHKPQFGPTAMNAWQVLRMATLGGAEALGMQDEIGSLEVGKKADLAILDLNKLPTFPSSNVDPVARIVYSAHAADVETTIVNGRILMEDGLLKNIDSVEVMRGANRAVARICARAFL